MHVIFIRIRHNSKLFMDNLNDLKFFLLSRLIFSTNKIIKKPGTPKRIIKTTAIINPSINGLLKSFKKLG